MPSVPRPRAARPGAFGSTSRVGLARSAGARRRQSHQDGAGGPPASPMRRATVNPPAAEPDPAGQAAATSLIDRYPVEEHALAAAPGSSLSRMANAPFTIHQWRPLAMTRFGGTANGDYQAYASRRSRPDLGSALHRNRYRSISLAWPRHENKVDLIEAFVLSARKQRARSASRRAPGYVAGISLEHSTGVPWSVVNTITPSAITPGSAGGEVVGVRGHAYDAPFSSTRALLHRRRRSVQRYVWGRCLLLPR